MKSCCLYIYIYPSQFLTIAAINDGTSDIYWDRLIRRKKQMTFKSIYFQVVESELFKPFFVVISRNHRQSLQSYNYSPQKTNHKDLC